MKALKEYLNKHAHFTANEMELFTSLFSDIALKKNEYFATEGEYSSKLAFINKGVVRAFYRSNQGNEYNKTFFSKKSFIGAYSSLITSQENKINIQCLTDCSFYIAEFAKIKALYDTNPNVERLHGF